MIQFKRDILQMMEVNSTHLHINVAVRVDCVGPRGIESVECVVSPSLIFCLSSCLHAQEKLDCFRTGDVSQKSVENAVTEKMRTVDYGGRGAVSL